ncbi:hypothetical protein [Nocardioides sp. Root140]|uniref:hypothetical protein n=1 Tax=Nocardioides sp. Root140 TaxID=1736460 RepID=UPI0006FA0A14|nr:hypothetical protein [Nocardioides sp. Root140]KQY62427.1 hypothetical protein ASD30_23960 [Nocardioides sp. Root140]
MNWTVLPLVVLALLGLGACGDDSDGGGVLKYDRTVWVSVGGRTDQAEIDQLAAVELTELRSSRAVSPCVSVRLRD